MDASEATRVTRSPSARTPQLVVIEPDDVAAGMAAIRETYARDTSAAGVCVADGFGVRVVVERGALEVCDGIGPYRRVRHFERATHGLRRLVLADADGFLTLAALRWCSQLGITVVVLAPDGTCQLASTPRMTDDARLRRTQALAPTLPVGLDLVRYLLYRKVSGQAALVARRFDNRQAAETIGQLADGIESAENIDEARQLEASAAALYFAAWSGRPECAPRFATRDARRIPSHWTVYEGRRSVLASTNANRKAERPTNALLNYLYALVEAEAVLACQVVGLDPGLGIVHLDARSRPSLALDLMEPVRPEVDSFVFDLMETRTFRKVDFVETSDGHVRVRSPLTHELAETMPHWARMLAPLAEHVAHALGRAMEGKYQPVTPLTRSRTIAAQAAVKARKAAASNAASSSTKRQRPERVSAAKKWACPECGALVTNPRRVRCDDCIAADPAQSTEVRGRRGRAIAARKRAQAAWSNAHGDAPYDPELFKRDILPRLTEVPLDAIMDAAGCSKSSASDYRTGRRSPHVSLWHALADLVGLEASSTG